ncbi:hypothetical protein CC80DRAFT_91048 [Byssothecium circinans]|uniref:SprT-like domain-containing protein n=1 Tax=Byssothecium circinans TaxID=147558 RepID=A0A6A5TS73_9PLEO|nr:hypothetical protein CC80DRAFT_91048 [Byssothecium circinans]
MMLSRVRFMQAARLPPTSVESLRRVVPDNPSESRARCISCEASCCSLLSPVKIKNRLGHDAYRPLHITRQHGEMQLVHACTAYFNISEKYYNNRQLFALHYLKYWLHHRQEDVLVNTPKEHTYYDLVSQQDLNALLHYVNDIFFGVPMRNVKISWDWNLPDTDLGETREVCLSSCIGFCNCPVLGLQISLNPRISSSDIGERSLLMNLLGTILHEAVHAFLMLYSFPTLCHNPRFWGAWHGRPWQVLAENVEKVFYHLTGLPVLLGRFDAIRVNWPHVFPLPTTADFDEWNFEREATYLNRYDFLVWSGHQLKKDAPIDPHEECMHWQTMWADEKRYGVCYRSPLFGSVEPLVAVSQALEEVSQTHSGVL